MRSPFTRRYGWRTILIEALATVAAGALITGSAILLMLL